MVPWRSPCETPEQQQDSSPRQAKCPYAKLPKASNGSKLRAQGMQNTSQKKGSQKRCVRNPSTWCRNCWQRIRKGQTPLQAELGQAKCINSWINFHSLWRSAAETAEQQQMTCPTSRMKSDMKCPTSKLPSKAFGGTLPKQPSSSCTPRLWQKPWQQQTSGRAPP